VVEVNWCLTIAEQWEQQAMERGIEKGIEKGIKQGEARLLKQLFTWRFGALPEPSFQSA